jgi:hypothetical protein
LITDRRGDYEDYMYIEMCATLTASCGRFSLGTRAVAPCIPQKELAY